MLSVKALIIIQSIAWVPRIWAQSTEDSIQPIKVGYFTDGGLRRDPFTAIAYDHCLILKQVGQTLVEIAASGEIMPGIARKWTISLDRRNYTFFIDRSLRFHDGQSISAYDVEASLSQAALTKDGPAQYYFHVVQGIDQGMGLRKILGFKALDDERFQITLKRPFAPLLRALTSGSMIILPRTGISRRTKVQELVGSGPYRITGHRDHKLTLEPYPSYKGPYPPAATNLEIIEDTSLVTARRIPQTHELPDYDHDVIGERLDLYQRLGYQFKQSPRLAVSTFVPNAQIVSSERLRRALFHLILQATQGQKLNRPASVLRDIYPKGVLGYESQPQSFAKLTREVSKTDIGLLHQSFKELRFGLPGSLLWDADSLAKKMTKLSGLPVSWVPVDPNHLPHGIQAFPVHGVFFNWANIFPDPESNIESIRMLGFMKLSKNRRQLSHLLKQASESAIDTERAFNYRLFRDLVYDEFLYLPLYQFERIEALKQGLSINSSLYRQTPMLGELIRETP